MTSAEVNHAALTRDNARRALDALIDQHMDAYRGLAAFARFIGENFGEELEDYVTERASEEAFVPDLVEFAQHLMIRMKNSAEELRKSNRLLSRDVANQRGELVALGKIMEILDGVRRDPESGL